jgi:hypothetical protein
VQEAEESEIYSSIHELRDQTADLQRKLERFVKAGDVAAADAMRRELTAAEAKILEKNEERARVRQYQPQHHSSSSSSLGGGGSTKSTSSSSSNVRYGLFTREILQSGI